MAIDATRDYLEALGNDIAGLGQIFSGAVPLRKPSLHLPDLSESEPFLEARRDLLAEAICERAAYCRDGHELFADLRAALGTHFPKLIAVGSTRVIWALPLGLVAKVERDDPRVDPLPEAELEERGGTAYLPHLSKRRRMANFAELTTAIRHPKLFVPVYGCALSFGARRHNPGVLVVKRLTTLNNLVPEEDRIGVKYRDLAIAADGRLRIYDPRYSDATRPTHGVEWLPDRPDLTMGEDGIWHGNLGQDEAGTLYFADRGNSVYGNFLTDYVSFTPRSLSHLLPGTAEHRRASLAISSALLQMYRERR